MRQELLRHAAEEDSPLSGPQLSRMHRAGLIEAPITRPLGRGCGTVSLYPPGTKDRLMRVLEIRREVRGFAEVAWRLWWEDGGPVPPAVRIRLVNVSQAWEHERERLGSLLAGEEAQDPLSVAEMEDTYDVVVYDRPPPGLGKARRNVGRSAFATVFRVLVEVASGRFDGYPESPDSTESSPEALVEQALGIDRARVDRLTDADPWFQGSSEEDFVRLSTAVGGRSFGQLASANDGDLDDARREMGALQRVILGISPVLERILGPGAFGFSVLDALFREQSPDDEAFMLLMWLALREDAHLREGMAAIDAVVPEALASRVLFEAIADLRGEIPAFAEAISDEALAAAMRDASAQQLLTENLTELFRSHRPEVDAFFERRPELGPAMAVFESP